MGKFAIILHGTQSLAVIFLIDQVCGRYYEDITYNLENIEEIREYNGFTT